MPKKSRRAKAKHRARVVNRAQPEPMPAEVPSPTRVSPKVQPSKVQDLTSRYQHVMPEMKRIGIIAGAIILVLIVLSFILG
ncbi:MAG: hypothetical protein KAQ73_02825 [Dehalococcoidia bacterium]|nr:hypothetical protein [Dehalococcoidia bacterium]